MKGQGEWISAQSPDPKAPAGATWIRSAPQRRTAEAGRRRAAVRSILSPDGAWEAAAAMLLLRSGLQLEISG
ncbi:hypothetical protein AAFF_G00158370 [Aldrovandia affinis]|uniref:Uncharacterized protein n=1 Tax=Aldrovandia affinis TaxID=143900 RepID=A0AAD7W7R3_9TELE|nr:hypothetical protein AAFF_G00158370 [Aldrovandia affinis]